VAVRLRAQPAEAPDGFCAPQYDDAAWDELPVPSCWQMQGYGHPHYTNMQFPFPCDPPHTPTENPTGSYRRMFCPPAAWEGRRLVLRFDGVDNSFNVWVNGKHVGFSKGSRIPAEFDITAHVQFGKPNVLAVQVYQWSDSSYIEDQDMWWLSGIYRDVTLLALPATHLFDLTVRTPLDAEYDNATLEVSADIRSIAPAAGKLEAQLFDAANSAVLDAPLTADLQAAEAQTIELAAPVTSPRKWSAEDPYLYTLIVTLRAGDGHVIASHTSASASAAWN
jgi:beta-galactosidase/beta-glucuronidase